MMRTILSWAALFVLFTGWLLTQSGLAIDAPSDVLAVLIFAVLFIAPTVSFLSSNRRVFRAYARKPNRKLVMRLIFGKAKRVPRQREELLDR